MKYLAIDNVEIVIEWRDVSQTRCMRQTLPMAVLHEHLLHGGSAAVSKFLRDILIHRVVDPLIDDILRDLVESERSQERLEMLIGSQMITSEIMEDAINEMARKRSSE